MIKNPHLKTEFFLVDFAWAKQSWPIHYFEVKSTDHRGITLNIDTKFHKRNRILRVKKLCETELKNLRDKCAEATLKTRMASELYSEWLKILRETYGSKHRNGSTVIGRSNQDLLDMGLTHNEQNP